MDIISLRHVVIHTFIGVHAWEKQVQQKLILSAQFGLDTLPAGQADDLTLTLDYAKTLEFIQTFTRTHHYGLLEALAEQLTAALLKATPARWIKLEIIKPGALPHAEVSVSIERTQSVLTTP